MKRALILLLVCAVGLAGAAQQPKKPIRITVRHADPWAVVALLEGRSLLSPEISTVMEFVGFPPPSVQGFGRLLPPGRLFVNPGDNSIWFVPDE